MNLNKKRIAAFGLIISLGLAQSVVYADPSLDTLKDQKSQTASQLQSIQGNIDQLEQKKNEITGQIDSLNGQLISSIAEINELTSEIDQKIKDIAGTTSQLEAAQAKQATQYKAMKKRIQYIYENGGDAGWAVIFLAEGDASEILNQAEYTQKMYQYDRNCLEEYAATVQQVSDLKTQQESEKYELESLKSDQETNKANLQVLLDQAKSTSANYDAELAVTYQKASEYQKLIEQQNQQIDALVKAQEAQARAEAAAAAEREASAKAAQKAAKESQARTSTTNTAANNTSSKASTPSRSAEAQNTGTAANTGNSNTGNTAATRTNTNETKKTSTKTSDTKADTPKTSAGDSATGRAIVSYAMGFVGNRYVFGGNSLTNGTDCSGFVNLIYAHFGISVPRSSGALAGAGRPVASLSQAQPGDILCYPGHVAIYAGNGTIVHASNSAPYPKGGIKTSPASYRTPTAIRRVV